MADEDKDKDQQDQEDKKTDPNLEEVQAELERTRSALKAANKEAADRRKRLEELETAEKQRADAQLSETEKLKQEAAEAKTRADAAEAAKTDALARAQEKLMRAAVLGAASKAGFHDPQDAWLFIDKAKIKAKDDDSFDGIKEALEAVVKAKPHLAGEKKRPNGTPRTGDKKRAGDGDKEQPRRTLRL